MSTRPVNLNRVRKDRSRAEERARANENAVKFGRTKGQKARDLSASATAAKHLDGHKRRP